jgi:DNA-binding SARP family transcriptional activator
VMEFRVLGSLQVCADGVEVTPSAPKLRGVLAFLVFRHNQVIPVTTLIDELWGEDPPRSALSTLQTYMYKLRKLLDEAGGGDMLVTKPTGYLAAIPPEGIDVCRFERYVAEGRHAFDQGDALRASEILSRALSMWRGPALADVATGERLSAHVIGIEECRLVALELRLEADLRLGRHRELVSELKELASTHPLHEALHAMLMVALSRSGRRIEALDTYQLFRRTLVDELGLEPGPMLRNLQSALLSDDALPEYLSGSGRAAPDSQEADMTTEVGARALRQREEGPREPPESSSKSGQGMLAVIGTGPPRPPAPAVAQGQAAQVTQPERQAGAGAQVAAWSVRPTDGGTAAATAWPGIELGLTGFVAPAQLPRDISDFAGRDEVLGRIGGMLAPPAESDGTAAGVVVLTGMPGVGKSVLAVRAAHQARGAFPDGQLYADLGRSGGKPADPGSVLGNFLWAAGMPEENLPMTLAERGKLFRSWTAGRRMLILLDDAVSGSQVRPLLPADAGCRVLVTSRHSMAELPGIDLVELNPMDLTEGLELLENIVGRQRLRQDPATAKELVQPCAGLPLAIRAVGSWLASTRAWPLKKVATRLRGSRGFLDGPGLSGIDVLGSFESSYRWLATPDQAGFRLLSLLGDQDFTAATAALLLGYDVTAAEAHLSRLVECHLLSVASSHSSGEVRYRYHKLAHIYASACLRGVLENTTVPATATGTCRGAASPALAVRSAAPTAASLPRRRAASGWCHGRPR